MPFSEVVDKFRGYQSNNDFQVNKRLKQVNRSSLRDSQWSATRECNDFEQNRLKNHKRWLITGRKVCINSFLDIKNCLRLNNATQFSVTKRRINVFSSYSPPVLLRLLRKLFRGVSNIGSIELWLTPVIEIKTSIPAEYCNREWLSRLHEPSDNRAPVRPYISSVYYAEPVQGLSVEAYYISGYKGWSYVSEGKTKKIVIPRDKTLNLCFAPLEFRFDLPVLKLRHKSSDFDNNIRFLKSYVLREFLFNGSSKAVVPFFPPPSPWRGSPSLPVRKIQLLYDGLLESGNNDILSNSDLDRDTWLPWNRGNYQFNLHRIQYIHSLLSRRSFYSGLLREWELKHPHCFTDFNQLDVLTRLATMSYYIRRPIKLRSLIGQCGLEYYLLLYSYCRFNKLPVPDFQSLFSVSLDSVCRSELILLQNYVLDSFEPVSVSANDFPQLPKSHVVATSIPPIICLPRYLCVISGWP